MKNTIVGFDDPTKVPAVIADVRRSVEAYNEEKIVEVAQDPAIKKQAQSVRHQLRTEQSRFRILRQLVQHATKVWFDQESERCSDPDSFKRNLNLYVLAEDSNVFKPRPTPLKKI